MRVMIAAYKYVGGR